MRALYVVLAVVVFIAAQVAGRVLAGRGENAAELDQFLIHVGLALALGGPLIAGWTVPLLAERPPLK